MGEWYCFETRMCVFFRARMCFYEVYENRIDVSFESRVQI